MRPLSAIQLAVRGRGAEKRAMRAWLCLPILLFVSASLEGRQPGIVDPTITAESVLLDPADPARDRVGALRYLQGWVLRSRDSRFGGISDLAVHGNRLLGISDTGTAIAFSLRNGRIADGAIRDLPAGPPPFLLKQDRDSEAFAVDPERRHIWIAFERHNEIWRYDAALGRAEGHVAPAAMQDWPLNGGPEAMIRLPDGRFMVFAEDAPGAAPNTHALLVFPGDPVADQRPPLRMSYRPPAGYVATAVAALPDGRLLVLNRRFRITEGVSATLAIVDPKAIAPGAVLEGRELARLAPPLTVDNMEGLAVAQERGRTIVWMISDDNFLALQRTILLKFALDLPER
jgi:hypothetical protein